MATDDTVLQDMVAKHQIHEALMRYCRGVDRSDPELIASAIHPDAQVDTGAGEVLGSDAPRRFGTSGESRGISSQVHFIGNELVEVDGDVAFSEAYLLSYMTFTRDGATLTRVRGGRYLDRWERRDGAWKVARRVVADDWSRIDPVTGDGTGPGGAAVAGKYAGRQSRQDLWYLLRAGKL
jgi:hypothetical protein